MERPTLIRNLTVKERRAAANGPELSNRLFEEALRPTFNPYRSRSSEDLIADLI